LIQYSSENEKAKEKNKPLNGFAEENKKTETQCKEKTLTFTQTLKSIEDQLYSSRK